jgi:alpha-D-xyloside xylohydrolase
MPRRARALAVTIAWLSALPAAAAELVRKSDGVEVKVGDGILKLEVCAEDIVRVAFAKDADFFARRSLAAAPKRCGGARVTVEATNNQVALKTSRLEARVDLQTGAVSFLDAAGQLVLAEKPGGRVLSPADVQGDKTFHVRQEWLPNADESLYGLGQHQLGLVDLKGYDLDLHQYNTSVVVPFLVSSRGYGILWDNTSYLRFGDTRPFEPIPAKYLIDANGNPGGLTGSYYAGAHFEKPAGRRVDAVIDIETPDRLLRPNTRLHPDLPTQGDVSVRWEGALAPDTTGDHLLQTFSNAGVKLWLDDRLLIDHWRQGWLPWKDLAKVRLEAGRRYRLRLEWSKDQGEDTLRLLWKLPAAEPRTSLWSEVGEGVDYYFMYGPALDKVVAGYRRVTGDAPMMPIWAFGLWQCRERYKTAQESLDVLEGFRSRGFPVDNIVQDWFYWKEDSWGTHQFDPARFPDPAGWIKAIHDKYHARLMISVWPKFYSGTDNFKALRARGFLYEPDLAEGERDWVGYPYTFYDAFNPEARKLFWSQVERELVVKDVDAWWMDATEPELVHGPTLEGLRTHMHPTALGTGARVLNAFPLVSSQAVYEGQRASTPDKRVFILTRSAFAGSQRYAAATWSGDITATWTAMRQQIAAGLGFSVSGIPYWTMDSGGFAVPARFARRNPSADDLEEWRELQARWFQFATFVPLLRIHGQFPYREPWQNGGESHPAYQAELKFDRIRYRLLPYVYSSAGAVTHEAGTLLRPLVMDFAGDTRARGLADEFLFGPSLLVSPVTTYKARSRSVYLPRGAGWYDLWTGAARAGGSTLDAPAPYDAIPVFVKAGSILPLGPELQYTTELAWDPIHVYVYAGADASFTLYEDEGVNYGYEKGAFSRIPILWNDKTQTLTIGRREGSFPGMLASRSFRVSVVSKAKPVAFSFTPVPDKTLRYRGEAVAASFR